MTDLLSFLSVVRPFVVSAVTVAACRYRSSVTAASCTG